MENLERQLEEIEVLQAIYPEELSVDGGSIEWAREQLLVEEEQGDGEIETTNLEPKRLSLTIRLVRLASLQPSGKLHYTDPSITVEFPPEYPETSPPIIANTSALDTEMMTAVQACLDDHSGEELTMQIVMAVNELIQTRNESTLEDYETLLQQRAQENQQSPLAASANPDTKPILGRRIINSPYILKAAKIKDLKKIADQLDLCGYAKVGKPGIVVLEGPEEACKQYCPLLEDRGWKYQTVQGQETIEGPVGGHLDDLRTIRNSFQVLSQDATVSDLSKLCREADPGLADLFFSSLNIYDSEKKSKGGTKGGNR